MPKVKFRAGQRVRLKEWVTGKHLRALDLNPNDMSNRLEINDIEPVRHAYPGVCLVVYDLDKDCTWIVKQCYLEAINV